MRRRWTLEELDARLVPTYLGNQLFPLDNPWNQVVAGRPGRGQLGRDHQPHRHPPQRHRPGPARRTSATRPSTGPCTASRSTWSTAPRPKVHGHHPAGRLRRRERPRPGADPGRARSSRATARPARPDPTGPRRLAPARLRPGRQRPVRAGARPPGRTRPRYPYGGAKPLGVVGGVPGLVLGPERRTRFRTIGATSADAAGLPILPGLVRPDEAQPGRRGRAGVIDHAIRMTVQQTRDHVRLPRLPRGQR